MPDPGYSVYVKQGKGAREALLEQRARQLSATTAPEAPELPAQYQTTYLQDYVSKDLPPAETLGRKVMMTQNMQDIKVRRTRRAPKACCCCMTPCVAVRRLSPSCRRTLSHACRLSLCAVPGCG